MQIAGAFDFAVRWRKGLPSNENAHLLVAAFVPAGLDLLRQLLGVDAPQPVDLFARAHVSNHARAAGDCLLQSSNIALTLNSVWISHCEAVKWPLNQGKEGAQLSRRVGVIISAVAQLRSARRQNCLLSFSKVRTLRVFRSATKSRICWMWGRTTRDFRKISPEL